MSARVLLVRLSALLGLAFLLAVVLLPGQALAQAPEPHQFIQEYNGPATCEACHGNVTDQVIHSVHYSWEGKMDHYSPVSGSIARINWLGILNEKLDIPGGCGRCHVGSGALPKPADQVTAEDKAGIDCLICHSPVYDTSLRFPVQDESGAWTLTQDRTLLSARQAQRPTSENCLLCHQNVGGGPMLKRGVDFSPVADKHGEASKADVHADAGMACVDCHASQNHKVLGFGPDLWSRDLPDQRLTCDSCHTAAPHSDPLLNDQHVRLDCRACHVLGTGGLIERDWTAEPVYDPVTELYSPVDDVRAPNSVQPIYLWHNGAVAEPGQPWPGSRSDLTARIQPFKLFTATVPSDADSGQPVPLKLDAFYTQGNLERAIRLGADQSGMDYSGDWQPKEMTVPLQISHGVVGKQDARACQDCHVPDGIVDFANMGYTPQEVAVLTSISAEGAGQRQPLQIAVVIPAAQPLPTPVLLSGNLEAARGFGVRIPWNPFLVLLVSIGILGGGGYWLYRQKPAAPGPSEQAAHSAPPSETVLAAEPPAAASVAGSGEEPPHPPAS
ncbi:MAG: hypothetical protein WA040_05065 [Anaerolineae bacterium]